jgi:hypothetical protein
MSGAHFRVPTTGRPKPGVGPRPVGLRDRRSDANTTTITGAAVYVNSNVETA